MSRGLDVESSFYLRAIDPNYLYMGWGGDLFSFMGLGGDLVSLIGWGCDLFSLMGWGGD